MDATQRNLSFASLQARIDAMPNGPPSILDTPRWIRWLNIAGTVAIVVGLMPFLLVQWLEAQAWMIHLAWAGVLGATVFYAPGFLRGLVVMAREFWQWHAKLIEQGDHDLAQFRALRGWLREFPREVLEEHRHFAELSRDRLGSKLALLTGGIERVGILPVLVAVFFLLREVDGLGLESLREVPYWQALLGPFLVVSWCLGVVAVRMRLQYDLYERVLTDALRADVAVIPPPR